MDCLLKPFPSYRLLPWSTLALGVPFPAIHNGAPVPLSSPFPAYRETATLTLGSPDVFAAPTSSSLARKWLPCNQDLDYVAIRPFSLPCPFPPPPLRPSLEELIFICQ